MGSGEIRAGLLGAAVDGAVAFGYVQNRAVIKNEIHLQYLHIWSDKYIFR